MSDRKSMFKRGYEKKEVIQRDEAPITLDPQQDAAVHARDSDILVVAGAGSGKTRVLTERVKFLLEDGVAPHNIVAITFTNMAAEEMRERLDNIPGIGDAFIGTIHSFANKVMKLSGKQYTLLNDELDNSIHRELITKYCKFLTFERFLEYKDKVTLAMIGRISEEEVQHFLTDSERGELNIIERSPKEIKAEIKHCGKTDYPESVKTICRQRGIITFDELLRMAERYFREINAHIEHCLVDEFQDVGTLEFNFIDALQADNYFIVGDDWQCQPAGTKVTMADGSLKNIENLCVGDQVLSCDVSAGRYYSYTKRGRGKTITNISVHEAQGLVACVTETGRESTYTANHRCFARIHYPGNENKSVVYIMKNDKGWFRVGSTQLFTENGRNFGVRGRMNTEGGVNAWILEVFDTPAEAWLCEQICAYEFGIPQTTWATNNTRFTAKDLEHLYNHLGDLRFSVQQCLERYGRDIKYPIFTKYRNIHFSKEHVTEVKACNLIPYVMDVAVPVKNEGGRYRNTYELLVHAKFHPDIIRKVYGLSVADTETYVADGILTHNSIYSFKGGNVNIFMKLIEDGHFHTFYLTNNYRNSKAVLDMADTIINQVSRKIPKTIVQMSGSEGSVQVASKRALTGVLQQVKKDQNYGDYFFLVRTNKDLYYIAEQLQDAEVPFTTFKREGMTLADLKKHMNSNRVKLLTVHVSKGLEAKNVILYGNFPVQCPNYRRDEEERKVMYVGITRAKENLVILN